MNAIREKLDHPVVDADGHQMEFEPILQDHLIAVAGRDTTTRMRRRYTDLATLWSRSTPDARREQRIHRGPWGLPATRPQDLATTMSPRLLYRRLDEFGIDFAIQYPTLAMGYARLSDKEDRAMICRAINQYSAEQFAELSDRLTPAAIVPTWTPDEAIAGVDHAVKDLGLKAIVIDCANRRLIPAARDVVGTLPPALAARLTWLDFYGVDSEYDYTPFWQRCVDLGVAVTAHMAGFWGSRSSTVSYAFNHIGLFGAANEAFCKSLLFAGVTRRFPTLRFGFLEGGVSWACSLLGDLVEHWEKRSGEALQAYDPGLLDEQALVAALREGEGERYGRHLASFTNESNLAERFPDLFTLLGWNSFDPGTADEWTHAGFERAEDIAAPFVNQLYFGCEAEDAGAAWALSGQSNSFGTRLNAMFGSDIGHWDVPDPTHVMAETYEAVEEGRMSPEAFKSFVFDNAVRLHGGGNPSFFAGTVIEGAANAVLAAESEGES